MTYTYSLAAPTPQVETGNTVTIVNAWGGGTDWTTATTTVPTTGMYKFVFIR